MDDIDALEIDEDEYSIHSLSSKRIKTATPASLVPEGWPALHNASNMVGAARMAQSPMAGSSAQQYRIVPQHVSHAQKSPLSPARRGLSDNNRPQQPQRECSLTSHRPPFMRAEWGQVSTSFARLGVPQPFLPPSQATMLGPQVAAINNKGGQECRLPKTGLHRPFLMQFRYWM